MNLTSTLRILGVVFVLTSGQVLGAGFQIQEQSVKGLGNAFAGGSAVVDDASTVFYNPAGLTRLERQMEFAGHIIIPRSKFKDQNSTNAIGGTPVGKTEDDGGKTAFVPNFYYANPINHQLSFGLGVSALYGLVTDYSDNWIGRYHALESNLQTININPALAYQVNEQFSLGLGLSAQYADATLSNALDFGTAGFLAGAPGIQPSHPAFDGFTEVVGDDWGFGFNLGVLFEASPATRLGLAYRSKIKHTLKGTNKLAIPDFATAVAGPSRTRNAEANLTTPATLSLSAYHDVNPTWSLMGDIAWTDWSVFDELRVSFSNDPVDPNPADSVQPQNWQDSFRYSFGVSYHHTPALTLRAGIAYDESPVPGIDERTPRIPDHPRRWLTFGASYQPSSNLIFDFGYAHIFVSDTPILDTELTTGGLTGAPVGNTLDGEYEGSVDIISAQLQWNF